MGEQLFVPQLTRPFLPSQSVINKDIGVGEGGKYSNDILKPGRMKAVKGMFSCRFAILAVLIMAWKWGGENT